MRSLARNSCLIPRTLRLLGTLFVLNHRAILTFTDLRIRVDHLRISWQRHLFSLCILLVAKLRLTFTFSWIIIISQCRETCVSVVIWIWDLNFVTYGPNGVYSGASHGTGSLGRKTRWLSFLRRRVFWYCVQRPCFPQTPKSAVLLVSFELRRVLIRQQHSSMVNFLMPSFSHTISDEHFKVRSHRAMLHQYEIAIGIEVMVVPPD